MKYFSLHTTAHIISLATAENSDMEFHKKELQRHCRVCAGLLDKKYAYTCQEQTNKLLLQKLGIDVDEDQPDVQPKLFCQSCRTKATQYSETVKSSLVVLNGNHTQTQGLVVKFAAFSKARKREGDQRRRRRIVDGHSLTRSNLLRTGSCIRHYLHTECHLLCLFLDSCRRQQFHSMT